MSDEAELHETHCQWCGCAWGAHSARGCRDCPAGRIPCMQPRPQAPAGAAADNEAVEACRCLQQPPHESGGIGCKFAIGDDAAGLLATVRRYCSDTKEKRDWPNIAERQAVKITAAILASDWLREHVEQAQAEAHNLAHEVDRTRLTPPTSGDQR